MKRRLTTFLPTLVVRVGVSLAIVRIALLPECRLINKLVTLVMHRLAQIWDIVK